MSLKEHALHSINEFMGAYQRAWNRRDPERLSSLYIDSATALVGENVLFGGAQIKEYFSKKCADPISMEILNIVNPHPNAVGYDAAGMMYVDITLTNVYLADDLRSISRTTSNFRLVKSLKKPDDYLRIVQEFVNISPDTDEGSPD